ncbi:MAG: hypothetical protein ACREAM_11835, partial [Blastocatellia bacterium]
DGGAQVAGRACNDDDPVCKVEFHIPSQNCLAFRRNVPATKPFRLKAVLQIFPNFSLFHYTADEKQLG